jgi:hypothetical protein
MRTALFWVVMQRFLVNPDRRFGTTYRYHLQGSIILTLEDVDGKSILKSALKLQGN